RWSRTRPPRHRRAGLGAGGAREEFAAQVHFRARGLVSLPRRGTAHAPPPPPLPPRSRGGRGGDGFPRGRPAPPRRSPSCTARRNGLDDPRLVPLQLGEPAVLALR